jgi:hypothetical protein
MRKPAMILIFLCGIMSCTEENTRSINGFWQLKTIENVDGTRQNADTIFLGIQSKALFSYSVLNEEYRQSAYVSPSYGYVNCIAEDIVTLKLAENQDPYNQFKNFWHSDTLTFSINKLTTNKLILNNETATYHFEKY